MNREAGAVEYDRCIDCDGAGHYPTGKQCRSCAGTPGRVPKGDGEPIAKSGAEEEVKPRLRLHCVRRDKYDLSPAFNWWLSLKTPDGEIGVTRLWITSGFAIKEAAQL
jgi:hypothetical protein